VGGDALESERRRCGACAVPAASARIDGGRAARRSSGVRFDASAAGARRQRRSVREAGAEARSSASAATAGEADRNAADGDLAAEPGPTGSLESVSLNAER
jgi:hypothetical protein